MRNLDKFRKFLSEDEVTDGGEMPNVPTSDKKEKPKEKMNKQKLAAIKDLQDAYLNGEFASEEDFLTQLSADTGLSFEDYHEFKEYMYHVKKLKKVEPKDDGFDTGTTVNSF